MSAEICGIGMLNAGVMSTLSSVQLYECQCRCLTSIAETVTHSSLVCRPPVSCYRAEGDKLRMIEFDFASGWTFNLYKVSELTANWVQSVASRIVVWCPNGVASNPEELINTDLAFFALLIHKG